MLIMSGAFGLWRAGQISNGSLHRGVTFVVLGVLGGTTWISGGLWAPDGVYTRFVSPLLLLVWGRGREPGAPEPKPRDAWLVVSQTT
jgi:hypothetical protein